MTYEKALKAIKKSLAVAIQDWDDPTDEYQREDAESLQKAKEAIEKQIPKKPKQMEYKPLKEYGWDYACPACGSAVGENRHDGGEFTQQDDYCATCGQKLLWGNEK